MINILPEYRGMFNMAYYLTTVIVNSDEPEQYYDEYLKRASEDYGISLCGTGFPGEIKCMCVMLMVYWLIDTMKTVRQCERQLLNRTEGAAVAEGLRTPSGRARQAEDLPGAHAAEHLCHQPGRV